ncbi:c2 domain containing protein [Stylonychia lemnae]|uniref:C2 domain containing protein n=1 Tax=Stylonychia lemnae TaxID=5949 RepID=A0A077ZP17_STYLE|nr:c2 domain containing protein [Stylonychia lemnae]|eukprot:CDW71125.1 c2 domain containing protein [Stylonychia lemnae]
MQSSGGGNLTIRIVEGKLYRDTEAFGKMDPFVQVEYNGNKYKTRVHQGGGKAPVWNHVGIIDLLILQEFQIHVGSLQDDLTLKVLDEDVTKDDFVNIAQQQDILQIGMSLIKMSSLCINNGVRDWFTINYKQKQAGQVLIETKYQPAGQQQQQPQMMGMQQQMYQPQQQPMMMQGFGQQQPPLPQYQGMQQPGYQMPQGYVAPQQYAPGYQVPPGGYAAPQQYPQGYQMPPQGYVAPQQYPPGYQMPPGYVAPQQYPPQGQYPPGYQYPQGQYPPGQYPPGYR